MATRQLVKSFVVRFYAARIQQPEDAAPYRIQDFFRELVAVAAGAGGHCPPTVDGDLTFELRDLRAVNRGAVVMGVFAVLRDDAPHIRSRDRSEREIPLDEDEGIIEKNHFIFYARTGLIVYQVNQRASHPMRFQNYLTDMAGDPMRSVVFGDILTRDAWERLTAGVVKKVEITVDAPRNPLAFDPDDFTGATLRTMEQAGAQRASVTLSAGRGEGMSQWIREQILRARGGPHIEKLQVKLDGEEHLLDLLANTVRDRIDVLMNGRYPDSLRTFVELEAAHDRQREALRAHFGE